MTDDKNAISDEDKWNLLTRRERLGEILLKHGKITLKQLGELMQEQEKSGKHIGELILLKGIMTREEILEALNWQNRSDLVSLESVIELKEKHKE
jgi:type IV pilus assembly protein PilB